MTDAAHPDPLGFMGPRAYEIVQHYQDGYSRREPIRFDPDGRWMIFGHQSSTTYQVERAGDGLLSVSIGGERENPSVDFVTNAMHAVDVFVLLELGTNRLAEKDARPHVQPDTAFTVDDESRTQRLEWPGGWAEGPISRRGGSQGWALPKMAHYITLGLSQIEALLTKG